MRVAIVGAGAAGLASAHHVTKSGFECEVFELNPGLGGTWMYTDDVGKDKYGYPVYSAMYKGLKTNLPKEVMGFPDFPIPEQAKSYLTQAEILEFLNLYADEFKIRDLIKFSTMVLDIRPTPDNKWRLTSVHKPTGEESTNIFDAVMICNGHYNDPIIPNIPGKELFEGKIEHSRDYRSPEGYTNQKVLVVGAGPSGLDLTLHVSKVAEFVVLSHRTSEPVTTEYPSNVQKKPEIKRILEFNKARYFCKSLDGSMRLPPRSSMRAHAEEDFQQRWAKGYNRRQAHMMGDMQEDYYNDLAADAKTTPIAPVLVKLRNLSVQKLYSDLLNFRNDRYKIVDKESFVKV